MEGKAKMNGGRRGSEDEGNREKCIWGGVESRPIRWVNRVYDRWYTVVRSNPTIIPFFIACL